MYGMYDMAKFKIVSKSDLLVLSSIKSKDNIHIAFGLTHQLNMSYHPFMMFMFAISSCMFVYKWRMGQIEVVTDCHGNLFESKANNL